MQIHGAIAAPAQSLGPSQLRLAEAAHEFEGQMMKEVLKPMAGNGRIVGDDSDSGSCGALGDFAVEALGQSLSRSGGVGIATSILRSLSQHETASFTAPKPGARAAKVALEAQMHS